MTEERKGRSGEQRPVRGRFAPSPTGPLHLGHAQTLLLAWLQVRALDGQFVLRIEDIDRERERPGATDAIVRDMEWLGFDWDEGPGCGGPAGPYLQSERLELYEQTLERLHPRCYPCVCSRKDVREAAGAPHGGELPYPGTCRQGRSSAQRSSLRIRVDSEEISWDDLWLGPQAEDPSEICGDFIVRSKNNRPVYQLACVVDDIAMDITHVLRGEDLVSSTSRQLLLYRWLGAPAPWFAHTPLRRDEAGQRLAKRRGSPALSELREAGAHPEQLIGTLAHGLRLIAEPTPLRPEALVTRLKRARPKLLHR